VFLGSDDRAALGDVRRVLGNGTAVMVIPPQYFTDHRGKTAHGLAPMDGVDIVRTDSRAFIAMLFLLVEQRTAVVSVSSNIGRLLFELTLAARPALPPRVLDMDGLAYFSGPYWLREQRWRLNEKRFGERAPEWQPASQAGP